MATSDHVFNVPAFTPIGAHSTESPVASTVVARPAASIGGDNATMVLIYTESQAIRYTLDGTVPVVATTGFPLAADSGVVIAVSNNTTLTIIEEAAAPAALVQVQWGK